MLDAVTPRLLPASISEFPSLPRHSANICDAEPGLFSRSQAQTRVKLTQLTLPR